MRKDMISKTLVVGVIFLFVGVGVQPAFAVESKSFSDDKQIVEDCDCQELDRLNLVRVKLLMTKLKVVANILLLRFRHIRVVAEKCKLVLNVINSDDFWDDFCDIISYLWNEIYDLIKNNGGIYRVLIPLVAILQALWFWFCWLR